MEARHIEKAAEFCKLVGSANLVDYLGLDVADVRPEDAKSKLKKRRKYMQGMQSNPKYKAEAVFLIKNFKVLTAVLDSMPEYLQEVRRAAESEHLKIVEITIKTVLNAGSLGTEQEAYLLKQATDLGVSEASFRRLLRKLVAEHAATAHPTGNPADSGAGPNFDDDYYALIGVDPHATRDDIYNAYRRRHEEARQLGDKGVATRLLIRLDKAWKILGSAEYRKQYDISRKRTGPPARERVERVAPGHDTAPPARERLELSTAQLADQGPSTNGPITVRTGPPPPAVGAPTLGIANKPQPRMDVIGSTNRQVELTGPTQESILVRNVGDGAMPGRVSSNVPWLEVSPRILDPSRKEQVLVIKIDDGKIAGSTASGIVSIQTDHGERATVQFSVTRPTSALPLILGGGAVGFVALVVLGLFVSGAFSATKTTQLTVSIDPTAEKVLLNGENIGSGSSVYIDTALAGPVKLEIMQANFKPYSKELNLTGGPLMHPVRLEVDRALDYVPEPGAKRANLDEDFVNRIMVPRSQAMDTCVRQVAQTGSPVEGSVRIHVAPDGLPVGVQLEGSAADEPAVRDCLIRQSAAALFHPFKDGDYATVRYEYTVTEAAPE